MNKPNLILINGFAVNKKPLKGFISYLNEFFKVYVIDLPGHGKNPETIETVTLNNIVEYADKKIQELNIKN